MLMAAVMEESVCVKTVALAAPATATPLLVSEAIWNHWLAV